MVSGASRNGGDEHAKREARKDAARLPADSETGLRRFLIEETETPVDEITLRAPDGTERTLPVYELGAILVGELELRRREVEERPGDGKVNEALIKASEEAVLSCVRGATRDDIKHLSGKQLARIIGIALGQDTDTPFVPAPEQTLPTGGKRLKARR